MQLTAEQQALLNGEKGEVMAKVMKTLVMYGETFGAEKMVPVTSDKGHLVTSFGLKMMTPVFDLMDQLLNAGVVSKQKFSVDPKPFDPNVPSDFLKNFVFKKFMYSKQDSYNEQLRKMGLLNDDAYTCACYLDEVGNTPKKGDILSWAESSAVAYANSVIGARCNRNSGIIEMMGSIAGFVPYFGLLTDEGRKATWVVEVKCKKKPEAQILGSAIGMKVMEDVPYVKGMNEWLGTELNADNKAYLKDFGAACASNGAVGLFHIAGLTPEAVEMGDSIVDENAQVYVIDDAELERVKKSYPVMWKNPDATPKLCFVGCPHMTMAQLKEWTNDVYEGLKKNGLKKVSIPTVFTAPPAVCDEFKKTADYAKLQSTGVVLSYICPLMYMNNPLAKKMPVITNSNKLRTYTTSRYYTSEEILDIITKEAK
ncbi:MAG: DUF521 domain-containing protein [Clostridia bacterium]|nr:DUF521 domain-containing protein [Clostridia bacterium]MBR2953594.1 DUF521 domain-containing protein [Clostridia bacterium]